MAEKQLVDEVHHIYRKRGNGQLRREVWVDERGEVTRYNLAYINHAICAVDNGRVVGYDNQHGYHHRHYLGDMHPIDFISFEDIEARFEEDWMALRRQ
ncbi:toxin-antitoxin system TumE family protein [Acidithiobacillus sp.]|uniref:toxin-antitoxin system TumE family protein n=1 Tax=Acidithiobacillus sp. TaxID=1872118 RepID=UPI0036059047